MSDQEGGTAFPVVHPDGKGVQYFGMTLRDYFAAKAMASMMMPEASATGSQWPKIYDLHNLAALAYSAADAMLSERS